MLDEVRDPGGPQGLVRAADAEEQSGREALAIGHVEDRQAGELGALDRVRDPAAQRTPTLVLGTVIVPTVAVTR